MDHLKISDDLYVLTLNDSLFHDDPVVSVCFICKFDFKTNLKVKQVNNALLEARVLAEHKFVTSFEHIYKVAATIVQPFDAIGLVIASLSTYP